MHHVTTLMNRFEAFEAKGLESPFSRELEVDRIELIAHLVHCCDLSGQTLPTKISTERRAKLASHN